MKIEQLIWKPPTGWSAAPCSEFTEKAQLILIFGARSALETPEIFEKIAEFYPNAARVGCSTSGEISGSDFLSGTLVATAIIFESTRIQTARAPINEPAQSRSAGKTLIESLEKENLTHVLVFTDGLRVNGTQLLEGLKTGLPSQTRITGGLAGDGEDFSKTLVCCDGPPQEGQIAAIGFYGSRLKTGWGSAAGWVPFGPKRVITRSQGNLLYEMDGLPAIDLYRSILNEESRELSAARFHFPLEIYLEDNGPGLVRTIVGINESDGSLAFAGDVPEGCRARLMKVNSHQIAEGAAGAARTAVIPNNGTPDLALLVSCVGRKIVLKQKTFQELEAVRNILGISTPLAGFYSYGELAPFGNGQECFLHNETMTITTFTEI